MAMQASTRRYTPEDLLALEDAVVFELIDGQLVERNVSTDASRTAIRAAHRLADYVLEHRSGEIYDSELGVRAFASDPDLVRRGDVLFVRAENVPTDDTGYLQVMPDLVVEVVSLNDGARDVRAKVDVWLEGGVRLVWVANPQAREITVYRRDGSVATLSSRDEIAGEDVIPGFSCPVARFFPEPAPATQPPPPV